MLIKEEEFLKRPHAGAMTCRVIKRLEPREGISRELIHVIFG